MIDYLAAQHGLHHLQLQPRLLVLNDHRLQVADFGLAHLLWVPAGQPVAQHNARYAAPELFAGQVTRSVDQYSLAVIYQEMLTGSYPYRGAGGKARHKIQPDLSKLPEADRAVHRPRLGRRSEPTLAELRRAYRCAGKRTKLMPRQLKSKSADRFAALLARPSEAPALQETPEAAAALNDIIAKLLASVGSLSDAEPSGELAAQAGELHHRFRAGLPVGAARLKLDACPPPEWYGVPILDEGNTYTFHVNLASNFWQQWTGRQSGLEVKIQLVRPHPLTPTPIDVSVAITPFRCGKARSAKLIEELGKPILDSVHKCLLINAEKRTQDRVLWPYSLIVCPVTGDGKEGPPIECRGKDISLTGMGFYLPRKN